MIVATDTGADLNRAAATSADRAMDTAMGMGMQVGTATATTTDVHPGAATVMAMESGVATRAAIMPTQGSMASGHGVAIRLSPMPKVPELSARLSSRMGLRHGADIGTELCTVRRLRRTGPEIDQSLTASAATAAMADATSSNPKAAPDRPAHPSLWSSTA